MSIDKNYCCIILTMKKIFLVIFLLIITNIPVFAEYKPIPETLSKQYKNEMEQIIDEEYPIVIKKIDNEVKDAKRIRDKILESGFNIEDYNPIVIKKIDNEVKDAKRIRDKILESGFNIEDYINLSLIPETCIPSSDLDLYGKMLKVTQEKYLGMEYKPIGTDSVNPLDDILSPYFRDNNVNRRKLTKILLYENKKIKIVEEYIKQVEKLRPTSNL